MRDFGRFWFQILSECRSSHDIVAVTRNFTLNIKVSLYLFVCILISACEISIVSVIIWSSVQHKKFYKIVFKVYKWHQIENLYFKERKFSLEIKNLRK
jgi:hypothetical protein